MSTKSAVLAALAVALVASGVAAAAQRSTGARVELHKTKLGKVLATKKGMTLYLYTPDAKNKSNCVGGCASIWPPLMTKGMPKAILGAKQSLLGSIKRGSKRQVTYKGHPLYRYTGDSKAGQVKGEGYGGIWYVVNAKGKKVAAKSSSGGTTTGGGYPPPPGY